jgi:hypothetical protein
MTKGADDDLKMPAVTLTERHRLFPLNYAASSTSVPVVSIGAVPQFNENASIGLRPRLKVAKDHRGEDDPAGEVELLSASLLHDCLSCYQCLMIRCP